MGALIMGIKELLKDIHQYCILNDITVSTIESCTAGELASLFTTFSGASKWFKGSIVPYATSMKIRMLGIDEKRLKEFGPVSCEIVTDMAKLGITSFGTSVCISTSGYLDDSGGNVNEKHCYICICSNVRGKLYTISKVVNLPFKSRHKNKELALGIIVSWVWFVLKWWKMSPPNAP